MFPLTALGILGFAVYTLIILVLGSGIGIYIASAAAARSGSMVFGSTRFTVKPARSTDLSTDANSDIVMIIMAAMKEGIYDAEIGRAVSRNVSRRGH